MNDLYDEVLKYYGIKRPPSEHLADLYTEVVKYYEDPENQLFEQPDE